MNQIIIHVDMDAFYASVEIRDNPSLRGKPLIIGSLPNERGVAATCSYEARKYGVRSGMNIKEAYMRCPGGIYMHPNFEKYRAVSAALHEIWDSYATASEAIALDEAYLDVTERAGSFDGACEIARTIKRRTFAELGLTCSVGVDDFRSLNLSIGYVIYLKLLSSSEVLSYHFLFISNCDSHDIFSLFIDLDRSRDGIDPV